MQRTQPVAWVLNPAAHQTPLTVPTPCLLSDPHCTVCGGGEAREAGRDSSCRGGERGCDKGGIKGGGSYQEGGPGLGLAKVIKGPWQHRRSAFLRTVPPSMGMGLRDAMGDGPGPHP